MKGILFLATALLAAAQTPSAAPSRPASSKAAASAAAPSESYKSLKFPPLKQVTIPVPESFVLPNGMKLYLLEDHGLPIVSGFALVRTGNLFDPPNKRGLADITGHVLRSGGTKAKTGDQIDEELENAAASVESSIGETSATVSFSSLKEHTDKTLAVFRDILTNPEFRQDKLDLVKTQYRSSISRRNDEPGDVASREFASLLYGGNSPYGWRIEYEHLDNIKREDLREFYTRYYFPANVMLAVYGDFKTADMKAKIEAAFASWTVKQPPVPAFPKVSQPAQPGIYFAEKKDVTQTFFQIGHLGGMLGDKDYPALQVAADILGQGFSSRLVSRVRTQLGYAYDVSATWGVGYDHPGMFTISGSTKSKTAAEALIAIREELEKIRTKEVTEAELNDAKQSTMNSYVFFFDRPSKTLNRLMQYEYYGYPRDFLAGYQKAVAAVTRADVLRVAKQYLRVEDLTIVAVGNPVEFGKPLTDLAKVYGEKFGTVKAIDLTIPVPKAVAPKADASKAGGGSSAQAKQVLAKAQRALGGAGNLAAIHDLTSRVEIPAMGMKQVNRAILPNILRQEQDLAFGKVVAYTDGAFGWLLSPQGLMPMPAAILEQARGEVFRQIVPLVLSDRDPSKTVSEAGPNAVEISGKDGAKAILEIGSDGLPAKLSYETAGQGGKTTKVEAVYSDWRTVDNIKLPFKMSVAQDGRKFGDLITTEIKLNTGLEPEELAKKPDPPKPPAPPAAKP